MIRDVEIRDRARRLGVDIEFIRKDYVLNHVLAAVAESQATSCSGAELPSLGCTGRTSGSRRTSTSWSKAG